MLDLNSLLSGNLIIFILFGYLCGSIPFGLIITKLNGIDDIRKVGSGNIGATNVLRTGKKYLALMTLILDVFKSYLAMILPITAGVIPFAVLIFKNFLDNVPNELLEAAKIDGAGSFVILRKIIMPISMSISVVVIIWTFLMTWNDYFTALAFVRDKEMLPVTHLPNYFLRNTMGSGNMPDYGPFFACLVLISLPVMILYIFLQRYIEDGITSGSIKK